ncbi:putative RNA methyltransferase [Reinekea marinisedimentorum]|uniref:23S rRNA (Guanine745-N1)-methyltransferase n=1 Tax=Reinekea marinisedimentorum TaxID=230495 RepID=A0A4R3IC63_9GAMM|nr:methyltransferase domain-containing protein [Reinekea marinisedimentorum]TCS43146.1 23S rRNA (guanine745-N1)-methyltransferase [Reinekea marinisedimentorum]
MNHSLYACPVCGEPLALNQNSWLCTNNHSFDKHKKGYVNLLLSTNKRSKSPGDDAQMIESRRRFLEGGHYQLLANHLSNLIKNHLKPGSALLDAGCGEGYYTNLLAVNNPDIHCYGLDISKPAIAAASKYKAIQWCVASTTRAPYQADQFDAIISVFSRIDNDGFHRLLREKGLVAIAAPDSDHLQALRNVLYEEVRPYDVSKHHSYLDERFELINESRIEAELKLTSQQAIQDLLGMTPHAHKLSNEARQRIDRLSELTDKACFKVYLFRKQS